MASRDGLQPTGKPGVFYKEHSYRRHGVKKDRQWVLRQTLGGKTRVSVLGWLSEGIRLGDALNQATTYKVNYSWNQQHPDKKQKPICKADENKAAQLLAEEVARQKILEKKSNLTFGEYFETIYFPRVVKIKTVWSWKRERSLFKRWLSPVIATISLKDIRPIHLERIKKNMADAKKSPRSICYGLSVIRQVFNTAIKDQIFDGSNPTLAVKRPVVDNKRIRFFSHQEAQTLLAALKKQSLPLYQMTLVSLHCGLRAGEIFSLDWNDIDISRGLIYIRNPKNKRSRYAIMTEEVKQMFLEFPDESSGLIFPGRGGKKRREISKSFKQVVDVLGFNDGIKDRRQRAVFHTCRHTYASWLVGSGVDLYQVKTLMGHCGIGQTERYSHLAPDTLQRAVRQMEAGILEAKNAAENVIHTDFN